MEEKNEGIKVYGDVCLRKERRKRQKVLLIELFLDYAQNSTLHGLRYIAERGLSIIEKVFWFVTFVLSFVLCFFLIHNVWVKWKTSPVIVSFSEEVLSVAKVPFPSVTICPQTKIESSKFDYSGVFSRALELNATDEEILTYLDVTSVCGTKDEMDVLVSGLTHKLGNFTNSSLVHNLLKVAPDVNEVFEYCTWRGNVVNCNDIFKVALTAEGVCFNFNALAASEMFSDSIHNDYKHLDTTTVAKNWTIAEGYTNSDVNPYPRRGRENGPTPDLEVLLKEVNVINRTACNSLRNGFKIFVQNPADLPQSSHYYYAALPNQVSSIAVKLNMLNTSETLKGYDPGVRQCYFPEDVSLRFFNVYTSSNCRLECQSLQTLQKCGCVWFDMPHYEGTPICTIATLDCVRKVQDDLAMGELQRDFGINNNDMACRCLPSCFSIQYDAEILKTEFNVDNYFKQLEKLLNASFGLTGLEQYSSIEMYFKEPRFVSMRRSELFGLTDFLANCGGLLGLFLGFSILSLVEIGYFVTLRLCCILKRDLKQEKSNFEIKDVKIEINS